MDSKTNTFTQVEGNLNLSSAEPGGSVAYVNDYKEMYEFLDSDELPGPASISGVSEMKEKLLAVIWKYDPEWKNAEDD